MSRFLDDADEISREDFIKLAAETKLTEFQVDSRERETSSKALQARDRAGDANKKVNIPVVY